MHVGCTDKLDSNYPLYYKHVSEASRFGRPWGEMS